MAKKQNIVVLNWFTELIIHISGSLKPKPQLFTIINQCKYYKYNLTPNSLYIIIKHGNK